jgi:hypothetical protein
MQTGAESQRANKVEPFTRLRVCRFLLIWLAAIVLVYFAFHLISTSTSQRTIVAPSGTKSVDK